MNRWYLSGPMSGYDQFNVPAFEHASKVLRAGGFTLVVPHEVIKPKADLEWFDYMRADLLAMLDCQGIILLRGWAESRGARLELGVALGLSMEVAYFDETRNVVVWMKK